MHTGMAQYHCHWASYTPLLLSAVAFRPPTTTVSLITNSGGHCFVCRFVLQSLLYPVGVSMDTLQASYSKPPIGEAQVQTLNRCVHLLQSVLISVLLNVPSGMHMPLTSNVAEKL